MTDVAAIMKGRRVVLNNLSPASVRIAYNYGTRIDMPKLKKGLEHINGTLQEEFDGVYAIAPRNGTG